MHAPASNAKLAGANCEGLFDRELDAAALRGVSASVKLRDAKRRFARLESRAGNENFILV